MPGTVAHVLGLGPSIHAYKPDGNFSIGCNDSFKYHPSNYLIVVSRLAPDRAKIVHDSRPEKLLSEGFPPEWTKHPNYQYIGQLHRWRDDRPNRLDKGFIYTSNNTPFISCSVAFNLGYREIVLWGVDFTNHPHLNGEPLKKTIQDFKQLQETFLKNRGSLYLGSSGSVLTLPLWG